VETTIACSYGSDPARFYFSSFLISLPLLTDTFHVPSMQIILECPSHLLSQSPTHSNTTHSRHSRRYPTPDLPPKIPQKLIRHRRLSPKLALRILREVSLKEVVRAGLVSFFFATPSPFTVTVAESSRTPADNDTDNRTGLQEVVHRMPSSCIMEMALSPFNC
jgi:hypothetical protein